jgi:hypothetical protein
MAKKCLKKCSPSLVIKEMLIKTTLRFLRVVELLPSRTPPITNIGNCERKKELLYTAGRNIS